MIDWIAAEAKMRASIEKQLKRNGHCQMHVRKIGRLPWRKRNGKATGEIPRAAYIPAYALAVKLCEEYGGKVCMRTYVNGKNSGTQNNNCSKVYQF